MLPCFSSLCLMLKQAQATLDDHVLKDGSWRDIDGLTLSRDDDDGAFKGDATAQVDGTGNGEVVKLNDPRNAWDALLEVRDLLEVISELDKRSIAEAG